MISRTITASASKAPSASDAPLLRGLTRTALVLTTALTPVWGAADTLPTGGSVVGGSAAIGAPTNGTLNIDQSSNRAAINWNTFSIGQGNTVNINQPSANASILNRVTGDTTSQIHGQLNANGRVFVVNPNGIFIGQTGAVRTGSFVASTLDIRPDDFMTGRTVFEGDGSSATVKNEGTIEVYTRGYAALIGGQVSNSGVINAPMGFVGLGSGERITLDLGGDGFMQVAVPTDTDDPELQALIENAGTIQANGGTVQMSAATARNAARHAINMSGVVEARTVSGRNGRITLGGGGGGAVSVSGKVRTKARRATIQVTQSARPPARPARGGEITITGQDIRLAGAEIDASGTDGGGSIRIGGELQGGPGLPTADVLTVDAGTVVNADAIKSGDGGRVILWSDLDTKFHGNISVRGGMEAGDGGFAEVSGREQLTYRGFTDARAPGGEAGTILLDPTDIEVVSGTPVANQLAASDVESGLVGGNFIIATSGTDANFPDASEPGTISVLAPISWNSGNELSLLADDDIIINQTITPGTLGTLRLNASDRVVINGLVDADEANLFIDAGNEIALAGSGSITAQQGVIDAFSDDDINIDGTITAPSSNITMEASGDILVDTFASINARVASVSLEASNLTVLGDIVGDNSSYLFQLGGAFTLTGSIDAEDSFAEIDTGNGMSINGSISIPNGPFSNGTLVLRDFGSTSSITVGSAGNVDVGLFDLQTGAWEQSAPDAASLASFDADNFVLSSSSSFRRGISGGSGPFLITDVYGLQGLGTLGTDSFTLNADIDAAPAAGWVSLDAPVNGVVDSGFVPLGFSGTLDGQGFNITGLQVSRHSQTLGTPNGGLFSFNDGTIRNLGFINATINAPVAGIVAGVNLGLIDSVTVQGLVRGLTTPGSGTFAGGITGVNATGDPGAGTITRSSARVTSVLAANDPSAAVPGDAEGLFFGGIAGRNQTTIDQTDSQLGSVVGSRGSNNRVGGIAGQNTGDISNSYVRSTTSSDSGPTGTSQVGGITGDNSGELTNVLANGAVSLTGDGSAGGITGADTAVEDNIFSSYFVTTTTGQALSGQNGEVDTGGPGPFAGARALTTAEVRDAQAFFDDASDAGWDFDLIWSLPLDGVDQARLYSNDRVISAFGEDPDPSFPYSNSTTGYSVAGIINGGPASYRFNFGDTGDTSVLNDQIELSSPDVGPVTYTFPDTFTSDGGLPYSVRQLVNNATVDPALVIIEIDDATKTYGELFEFADVSFTADTFFGSDGITSADVISLGAPETATVAGSPYDLTLDEATFVGTGLDNYFFEINVATLTVDPRPLDITVNNTSKVYGDALTFAGTEFSTSGLVNTDTVDNLLIDSAGAATTASVTGSPYAINGSMPTGTGLDNYTISIIPGTLTVTPRPLTISTNSVTKTYGEEISLGSGFSVSGLVNGDTVTSLSLSSAGTAATAPVSGSPYPIAASNVQGSGIENYAVNVTTGTVTVNPAPLTITADDQEKRAGTEFTFTGGEFTVTGLLNSDAVNSVTLTSDAAAANAPVTGPGGAAILITDPDGTGLDNYTITFVNGIFVVAPGDLVITANDITKVYGEDLTLDQNAFTVTGLADGDSVDSVTITSAGAPGTAPVSGSPYVITVSDAVGTGLDRYELVFADGSLTVVPAPLTVTALDQTKQQGQAFTFEGTEFAVDGLLNDDTLSSATLFSAGADAGALAEDGPFSINVSDPVGTGLDNYTIASADGTFTVNNSIPPVIIDRQPSTFPVLPNPTDPINIVLPGDTETGGVQERGRTGGGAQQSRGDAENTLVVVDNISENLELAIESCGTSDQDFTNFMRCLSESLDTYANALDEISNDLPEGFENVSAVIQNARAGVDAAAARAERRLATATTDAQRRAIRADAINEARGAINEAKEEIRKAITLIRADDPEVAAVQRQTGARIVAAFDTVDSELVRAVEL